MPFLPEKGTFRVLPGVALSRGRDIPGHSRKNTVWNTVSFPPLNYPCLVGCCVGSCFVVMLLSVSLFTLLPRCQHRHRHHHWHAAAAATAVGWQRRMSPATQTPTAALPHWRKLSAGRWNPTRHWTGPSQPVAWAAKAATMMAAPMVAAEGGSRTRSVWSSPPPPKAARQQRGWRASEGRGDKEGDCNGNKGGKQ
jgi:hypothetical protein